MCFHAVIVLANLMDAHGRLNDESCARVNAAIEAYHQREAPLIVTCGWAYREDSPLPIAHAMREYAVEQGVPSANVIADIMSRDTVGDAVFTKQILAIPRNWRNLLVITSTYHVNRTKEVFSFIYGPDYVVDVRGAPSDDTAQLRQTELASTLAFRSTFHDVVSGDDEAILKRLQERHPFYNGMVYPKLSSLVNEQAIAHKDG